MGKKKIKDKVVPVPILPPLQRLLDKYDYDLSQLRISDDKLRKYFKEVVKIILPDAKTTRITFKGNQPCEEIVHKVNSRHFTDKIRKVQSLFPLPSGLFYQTFCPLETVAHTSPVRRRQHLNSR